MLERTDAITHEVLEPITFVLAYPTLPWCTEGGFGVLNPPPKFRRPSKIVPNSTRFVKTVKNC